MNSRITDVRRDRYVLKAAHDGTLGAVHDGKLDRLLIVDCKADYVNLELDRYRPAGLVS